MAYRDPARKITNSAARMIKEITDYLTCPVCYQMYANPKYLSCHHSCCENCLVKLQKESTIVCPECRKVTHVCTGGVRELPNNFFITRLVGELTVKHTLTSEEAVTCGLCIRGAAVEVFCFDCALFMCSRCHEHHKYGRQCHDHNTIPLSDISPEIVLQPKADTTLCPEHENELKYYCESCKELVCLYCTTKKHSTHEHEIVKKVIGKHRKNLEDVVAPISKILESLFQARQQVDGIIKEIDMQYGSANRHIESYYEKLYQRLQQQKDVLVRELNDTLVQSKKLILMQAEQLECLQGQFESIRELNKTLGTASDQEILLVEQEIIARVNKLTSQYSKVEADPTKPVIIQFIPCNDVPLPQFGQLFTSLQCSPLNSEITFLSKYSLVGKPVNFTVTTRNHFNQFSSVAADDIVVKIESEGRGVIEVKPIEDDDGTYTGSFIPRHVGQATVSVILGGQHIRGSPRVVTVGRNYLAVDRPSQVVNNEARMGHPWGIAFSKDGGRWAATDCTNSCVYVYSKDDELVSKFSGSEEAQLYNPCGIAFDHSENLYVVDGSSYGIKKFDTCGNFLLYFSCETEQLENPLGIVVHDNKVYVTSRGCVLVFDTEGHLDGKIGSGVLSMTPYDVVIGCNNHLLVADSGFHCIFTFTPDGKYVSRFGTEGVGNSQLNSPHGVTVDPDGFILIIDYNNRVSIFDCDGICLHHFGSLGSKPGQFKFPHGIAISPNGKRIFTSDYSNNRIQIFEITD